jgi:hypothetical protein
MMKARVHPLHGRDAALRRPRTARRAVPASSRRGVALVITLIFLSIITFMAITFLVVSRHASEAVTTVTQQAISSQAAQSAVEQAEVNIVAAMTARGDGFSFGPVISQNYQSPGGFTNNVTSPANVNYFDTTGKPLDYRTTPYLQMLNNLLVLPRPPVVITTNSAFPPDFRFYLDLNRNGLFDPSEPTVIEDQFKQFPTNLAGDPEWIGILEHSDQPHSRSNLFVARYCFFAQPIGNSLDINFIHNQTKQPPFNPNNPPPDGFLRNQGVGSWEINLAGFLYGLNPFVWTYGNGSAFGSPGYLAYNTNSPGTSLGTAFTDAAGILQTRYNPFYGNLPSMDFVYPKLLPLPYPSTIVDYYSQGPLMTNESAPTNLNQNFNQSWPGNGNVNQFFTTQDPLNPAVVPGGFTVDMANATAGNTGGFQAPDGRFNEYTYYRMLSQMGMDSAPEPSTKLNLNYVNIGGYAATNFVPWSGTNNGRIEFPLGSGTLQSAALVFFTNAADRLLATQPNYIVTYPITSGVGLPTHLTNLSTAYIPIFPVNYYTPSVNRMLQLAANIYDAANPKPGPYSATNFDYPSVFRPIFGVDPPGVNTLGQKITNIYIRGYVEVTPSDNPQADNLPYYSLTNFPAILGGAANRFSNINGTLVNVSGTGMNIYGIPWIIGAKKGLPNFNQVSLESFTALSRKLQLVKPGLGAPRANWHTNVQYVLSASNVLSADAWNSYSQSYPRAVDITGFDVLNTTFTNEHGIIASISGTISNLIAVSTNPVPPYFQSTPLFENSNTWLGTGVNISSNISISFRFPLLATNLLLPGSIYGTNPPQFASTGSFLNVPNALTAPFSTTTGFPLPRFGMNLTNCFSMTMVDDATKRVIDHVQLEGMNGQRDLTGAGEMQGGDNWGPGGVWFTNREQPSLGQNSISYGMDSQISASLWQGYPPPYAPAGYNPLTSSDWNMAVVQTLGFNSVQAAVTSFSAFFNNQTNINSLASMQVPFTPTRDVCVYYTWQANDPLVHYTLPDLTDLVDSSNGIVTNWTFTNIIMGKLGQVNQRYNPWGGSINGGNADYNNNLTLMDPMQTGSDAWQFPNTNLPGVGWLGRVHRGTPWQTVYMKSAPVDPSLWQKWTGNTTLFPNAVPFADSFMSSPINDWAIFDLFTAAPNDNATRGQLSVNQPNYAAWAAVLDGVIVLTNSPTKGYVPVVIDPNDPNGPVFTIYQSIQNARLNGNRYGGLLGLTNANGVFTRLGDILAAPALSVTSPFLDIGDPGNPNQPNDIAYEWLPQQIMSLLRVGQPRYVIYAYGQSLKPAQNSIVSGGPFYGTCTNYQITGEMETRTVVRFEPATPASPMNVYSALNPTQNPLMPLMLPGDLPGSPPPRPPVRAIIESYSVLPPE